jgi:hypothetical protein
MGTAESVVGRRRGAVSHVRLSSRREGEAPPRRGGGRRGWAARRPAKCLPAACSIETADHVVRQRRHRRQPRAVGRTSGRGGRRALPARWRQRVRARPAERELGTDGRLRGRPRRHRRNEPAEPQSPTRTAAISSPPRAPDCSPQAMTRADAWCGTCTTAPSSGSCIRSSRSSSRSRRSMRTRATWSRSSRTRSGPCSSRHTRCASSHTGILPSVLTHGGLRAGVDAFASRLDLPVDFEVLSERLPPDIEASAYFIVAEARPWNRPGAARRPRPDGHRRPDRNARRSSAHRKH